MSYAYWNAWGVPKNEKIAKRWLEQSVNQSYPLALVDIGQRKIMGNGYSRNVAEAITVLKQAIELGASDAQVTLGAYYLGFNSPDGVIDNRLGMEYLLEAKFLNNPIAMMFLGLMYQTGLEPDTKLGSDLNIEQAIYWHTQAAERLNIHAIGNLGFIYSIPHFNNIDTKKAYFWFLIAEGLDVDDWLTKRIEVELRLSRVSRSEMKAKAGTWLKIHNKSS